MTAPVVDGAAAAVDLVRWAIGTTPRKPKARIYDLTPEDDYAAWLDRLATRMAEDQTEAARAVRKPTTWKPRPYTNESEYEA